LSWFKRPSLVVGLAAARFADNPLAWTSRSLLLRVGRDSPRLPATLTAL
jgi:hypothetical protein